LQVQDLNTTKCKKSTPTIDTGRQPCKAEANNKQQTNEQASTNPTTVAGPQTRKVEPNNNKKQPTNERTSKQATTIGPVNNICIFNDDQIASQAQKKSETYDNHASGNN
jgi:hypothetical protein